MYLIHVRTLVRGVVTSCQPMLSDDMSPDIATRARAQNTRFSSCDLSRVQGPRLEPVQFANIPYGQSSAKLPVTWSFGHMVIRSLSHSVTQSLSH